MELNSTSIHDVIHPTAAFSPTPADASKSEEYDPSWDESQLNPKNRVDSVAPLKDPLWRIDGSTGQGSQYYALPTFMADTPPMRFDVYIPGEATKDPRLRSILDLDLAYHTKDTERVRSLAITNFILRRLQLWTQSPGEGSPEAVAHAYRTQPFGSRILFDNLDLDLHKVQVRFLVDHTPERQYVPLCDLRTTLRLDEDFPLPPAVDVSDLSHIHQLHDSVCTVHFNERAKERHPDLGLDTKTTWIFKTILSDTKFLYSELRVLLRMPSHPNVMARPEYLVTKKVRFGEKVAVLGFILPFHSGGSLRDVVPLLRVNGHLTLKHQMKWAVGLTSACQHVRTKGRMFYPDFRLDNVVLTSDWEAVMVDFEQRGVWCEFGPPEVNSVDYVKLLADDSARDEAEVTIPDDIRQRYVKKLNEILPDWESIVRSESYSQLPHHYDAYNIPWLSLNEIEQEAAEVYMLGRVLWCLFEGQSIPHTTAVWQSYRFDPDLEWPRFKHTPEPLRDIIDRCTNGRRPAMITLIIRRGSKLVFRADPPGVERDRSEVLKAAREWWRAEVAHAEEFLAMRQDMKKAGLWTGNYYNRPTFKEVMEALQEYAGQVGWQPGSVDIRC